MNIPMYVAHMKELTVNTKEHSILIELLKNVLLNYIRLIFPISPRHNMRRKWVSKSPANTHWFTT